MKASLIARTLLLIIPAATAQTITSKPTRYGPVTEGYFKGADGVRLFYRKVGRKVGDSKNTVVFLHGGPGLGIGDGGYDMEPLARNRAFNSGNGRDCHLAAEASKRAILRRTLVR